MLFYWGRKEGEIAAENLEELQEQIENQKQNLQSLKEHATNMESNFKEENSQLQEDILKVKTELEAKDAL